MCFRCQRVFALVRRTEPGCVERSRAKAVEAPGIDRIDGPYVLQPQRIQEQIEPASRLGWVSVEEPEPSEGARDLQPDLESLWIGTCEDPMERLADVVSLKFELRGDFGMACPLQLACPAFDQCGEVHGVSTLNVLHRPASGEEIECDFARRFEHPAPRGPLRRRVDGDQAAAGQTDELSDDAGCLSAS